MSWMKNYIDNIAQSNEDYYKEYTQEWINWKFDDTTLLRTIKEEKYPFNNEYEEYEVQIDSVAEITVNIIKVIGDYITVLFKDCSHMNYRGQKYIYNDETYLCYDKISELSKIAETRLIRCNNSIHWIDEEENIYEEKIFLGYELSSTNNSVGKAGITTNRRLLIYMQNNDNTKKIKINQRFMFNHNQCFRVEEIDNYNNEVGLSEPTMIKMYLVYSPSREIDNSELNICDYYSDKNIKDYKIEITENSIQPIVNYYGESKAVVYLNGEQTDEEVIWSSNNSNVISIQEDGEYNIVGSVGQKAIVYCCLASDETIKDSIEITIRNNYDLNKKLIICPSENVNIREGFSAELKAEVYLIDNKYYQEVYCIPNWNDDNYFTITKEENIFIVKNNRMSYKPLILTFKSEGCEDVNITVNLNGII